MAHRPTIRPSMPSAGAGGLSAGGGNRGTIGAGSNGPSPVLLARINEKKAELDRLRSLRDLSAQMASQMGLLEQRLSTLSDGTEAIALVLANWHSVLNAIGMASVAAAHVSEDNPDRETIRPLPETLVRIPAQSETHQED